ncbi:MAG TPA: zinc ribbon domain-containing protein, partial [Trebonia sp.]
DGGPRVLPTFAESLSRKATKRLTKLGVEVSTGVWFASSKMCAGCGAVKAKLSLSERTYKCTS